jgi:FkbM family methyltransferase
VYEFPSRRANLSNLESLSHPAGVELRPHKLAADSLITLETINAVRDGSYCADLIERLPETVRPNDRVLVIGAGLGVISTLVAKMPGVSRVIAVEPNVTLIPHLEQVHDLNAVQVETINAVLGTSEKGRVPFFGRRDLRASSPAPHDGPWEVAMMVPTMNLDLVVTEERISVIICEHMLAPEGLMGLEGRTTVRQILLGSRNTGQVQVTSGAGLRLVANSG